MKEDASWILSKNEQEWHVCCTISQYQWYLYKNQTYERA